MMWLFVKTYENITFIMLIIEICVCVCECVFVCVFVVDLKNPTIVRKRTKRVHILIHFQSYNII